MENNNSDNKDLLRNYLIEIGCDKMAVAVITMRLWNENAVNEMLEFCRDHPDATENELLQASDDISLKYEDEKDDDELRPSGQFIDTFLYLLEVERREKRGETGSEFISEFSKDEPIHYVKDVILRRVPESKLLAVEKMNKEPLQLHAQKLVDQAGYLSLKTELHLFNAVMQAENEMETEEFVKKKIGGKKYDRLTHILEKMIPMSPKEQLSLLMKNDREPDFYAELLKKETLNDLVLALADNLLRGADDKD